MYEEQEIVAIDKNQLIEQVGIVMNNGYRLVQIGCTKLDKFQIDYTFDKDNKFLDFRLELPLDKPELPSISAVCLPAFLYENELHDLFGIKISNISIDFKGKFYRIEKEAPFCASATVEEKKD